MRKTETELLISEYSTDKLLSILQKQANSYSEQFIEYVKDELIKRNITFNWNEDLVKKITALSDVDLKLLVEKDYDNYHLECLEIAREEYLKRGFKNEAGNNDTEEIVAENPKESEKYPALRVIIIIWYILGFIYLIIILWILVSRSDVLTLPLVVAICIIGSVIVISSFASAELIKIVLEIEKNISSIASKDD